MNGESILILQDSFVQKIQLNIDYLKHQTIYQTDQQTYKQIDSFTEGVVALATSKNEIQIFDLTKIHPLSRIKSFNQLSNSARSQKSVRVIPHPEQILGFRFLSDSLYCVAFASSLQVREADSGNIVFATDLDLQKTQKISLDHRDGLILLHHNNEIRIFSAQI